MYCLQVYKNETLIDEYWLKTGNYLIELPDPQGEFLIQYPKCPVSQINIFPVYSIVYLL